MDTIEVEVPSTKSEVRQPRGDDPSIWGPLASHFTVGLSAIILFYLIFLRTRNEPENEDPVKMCARHIQSLMSQTNKISKDLDQHGLNMSERFKMYNEKYAKDKTNYETWIRESLQGLQDQINETKEMILNHKLGPQPGQTIKILHKFVEPNKTTPVVGKDKRKIRKVSK